MVKWIYGCKLFTYSILRKKTNLKCEINSESTRFFSTNSEFHISQFWHFFSISISILLDLKTFFIYFFISFFLSFFLLNSEFISCNNILFWTQKHKKEIVVYILKLIVYIHVYLSQFLSPKIVTLFLAILYLAMLTLFLKIVKKF